MHFSLSRPVWCTGGPSGCAGLTEGKKRLFLIFKLLSCLPPRRFISSLAEAPGASLGHLPVLSELQPAAQRDPELGKPCQRFGSLWIGDAGEFLWQIPGGHRNPIGPGGSAGRFQLSQSTGGRAGRCLRTQHGDPTSSRPGGTASCGSDPPHLGQGRGCGSQGNAVLRAPGRHTDFAWETPLKATTLQGFGAVPEGAAQAGKGRRVAALGGEETAHGPHGAHTVTRPAPGERGSSGPHGLISLMFSGFYRSPYTGPGPPGRRGALEPPGTAGNRQSGAASAGPGPVPPRPPPPPRLEGAQGRERGWGREWSSRRS